MRSPGVPAVPAVPSSSRSGLGGHSSRYQRGTTKSLPAIDALIERAWAVRRWLEVASACECSTLDVCALFDDRALGLRELSPERDPRKVVAVLVSPGEDRHAAASSTT